MTRKTINFEEVAQEVAGLVGVWHRLLTEHVKDRLGRCAGCREVQGPGHVWPCNLRLIALRARELDPTDVCHGCGGPAEGLVCGACEKAEREARKKEQQ